MNIIKQTWNETHPIAKTVIAVGGVVTIGFLIYKSWSGIKTYIKTILDKSDAKNELGGLAQQGIQPTLTDTQITTMISVIVNALSGWTEDEVAVKNQLSKVKNQADWLKLNLMWGTQKICDGIGLCDNYDLSSAIQEFIPEEREAINSDFSNRGVGVTI